MEKKKEKKREGKCGIIWQIKMGNKEGGTLHNNEEKTQGEKPF